MNISVQTLLAKMEDELKQAKSSSKEENLREKIYSIKILCELILEQGNGNRNQAFSAPAPQSFSQQPVFPQQQTFAQPLTVNQPKKLDEDQANGDSLFDF